MLEEFYCSGLKFDVANRSRERLEEQDWTDMDLDDLVLVQGNTRKNMLVESAKRSEYDVLVANFAEQLARDLKLTHLYFFGFSLDVVSAFETGNLLKPHGYACKVTFSELYTKNSNELGLNIEE